MVSLREKTTLDNGDEVYVLDFETGPIQATVKFALPTMLFIKKGPQGRTYTAPRYADENVVQHVDYLLSRGRLPYGKRSKSRRPRDSQKSRVYRSEASVSVWGKEMIPDISDVQYYVNRVVQSAWWRSRFPEVTYIDVHTSRACRGHAYARQRRITMPPFSRHPLYILHEVAHIASDHDGEYKTRASHGPEYCRVYLDLVGQFIGEDVAEELRLSMDANKVKY